MKYIRILYKRNILLADMNLRIDLILRKQCFYENMEEQKTEK